MDNFNPVAFHPDNDDYLAQPFCQQTGKLGDESDHEIGINGHDKPKPEQSRGSDMPGGYNRHYETKDSGQRTQFATGAQRDCSQGKGRYDLLPPEAIARVAQLYERGAMKYDARNWEKGIPISRMVDSMLRHAFQVSAGMEDEDHAAAVIFNAAGIIAIRARIAAGLLPSELDDMPCATKEHAR